MLARWDPALIRGRIRVTLQKAQEAVDIPRERQLE